ncbi:MAG: glycosyltransferase family 4 protein [Bacteroidetes bacterium]|nr:glycosyltransferase family 4 protein [Bacteroidota bacterium]
MKVYINGRFLSQERSGVQYFASGIVPELMNLYPEAVLLSPKKIAHDSRLNHQKIGFLNGVLWEQISLPFFLLGKKDHLLINLCNSAPLFLTNNIVTIHDLAFEQKGKNWFKGDFKKWYQFLIPRICKSARLIFTVSSFSKKEIEKHYMINAERIKVIPNGILDIKTPETKNVEPAYLLITSINDPRKNANWILKNMDIISANGYKLVMIKNNSKVFRDINIEENANIQIKKYLSDEAYIELLKNASALLYPSEYEGFGIPILESLIVGTPVIASNLGVFQESFGTLPIYFEQGNKTSFEKAIQKIKDSKISVEDQQQLKERFNFKRSVQEMVKQIDALKI